MTRLSTIAASTFDVSTAAPITSHPCADCDGVGQWLGTMRVSGEYLDADQVEVICETCGGTGETECDPECPYCDAVIVGGRCDPCGVVFIPDELTKPEGWL